MDENMLKCLIAENKYGKYCVPKVSAHRRAARVVINGNIWEPKTINFLIKNHNNKSIVHAGTYFGDFLPALANLHKVWAFEPNITNWKCARETMRLNDIKNIILINGGLGEKEEEQEMLIEDNIGRHLGGGSRIYKKAIKAKKETVQLFRLDDVIPITEEISIIQLDVEKHELFTLKGAYELICRCSPILILESVPNDNWFTSKILGHGYKKTTMLHQNTVFAK